MVPMVRREFTDDNGERVCIIDVTGAARARL
jgi:hypothetical protein